MAIDAINLASGRVMASYDEIPDSALPAIVARARGLSAVA
jgi:hypothetical protein